MAKDQDLSDNQLSQLFTGWEKAVIIYEGEKKCKELHKLLLNPNPKQAQNLFCLIFESLLWQYHRKVIIKVKSFYSLQKQKKFAEFIAGVYANM